MNGLNLGLAVNLADHASANAKKIATALDSLMKMASNMGREAKKTGSASTSMGREFHEADVKARRAAGGLNVLGRSAKHAEANFVDFRAGIVRLFPYVSLLGGIYAAKRGIESIVETAANFRYAMANIKAVSGASNEELRKLEKTARSLALNSAFTATQVAESMYDMVSMGVPTEKIGKLTNDILSYATALQYDVKEAGLDVLALVNKFDQPIEKTNELFDKMGQIINLSTLTPKGLSEMLKLTGTEAAALRMSFDELLGVAGTTDLVFRGSEGGTRLRMIFNSLTREMPRATKVLEKYGLTFKDVDIQSKGFYNVLKTLQSVGFKNLGDASGLVEQYSASLLLHLIKNAEQVKKYTENVAASSGGVVERMKKTQLESIKGGMLLYNAAVQELKLSLYDTMDSPFGRIVGRVGAFIRQISGYISANKAPLMAFWSFIGRMAEGVGEIIARWVRGALRWMGVIGDTTEQAQRHMKNNLLPFLVFLEVARLRVTEFAAGFAEGFLGTFQRVGQALSIPLRILAGLFDLPFLRDIKGAELFGKILGIVTAAVLTYKVAAWGAAAATSSWVAGLTALAKNPVIMALLAGGLLGDWVYQNWIKDSEFGPAARREGKGTLGWFVGGNKNSGPVFSPNQDITGELASSPKIKGIQGSTPGLAVSHGRSNSTGLLQQKIWGTPTPQSGTVKTSIYPSDIEELKAKGVKVDEKISGAGRSMYSFEFGDIIIKDVSGDPEKIAREIAPVLKRVMEQEMKR